MKFSIDQSIFRKSLGRLLAAVDQKTPMPILAFLLLEVDNGTLTLTATNMDLAIVETLIPSHIVSPGRITAPAHVLNDIVSRLPQGAEIDLEIGPDSKDIFTLKSGKSVYDIKYMPADLFPKIQPEAYTSDLTIAAKEIRGLIQRTVFSVAPEEHRSFMSGIYLHPQELNGITAVATDGHRIAKVDSAPMQIANFPGMMISTRTADALLKVLMGAEDAEQITLKLSPVSLMLTYGNITLISKLLNAVFPPYQQVIPVDYPHKIVANRDIFIRAVDRIALFADKIVPAIDARISKHSLKLSVHGNVSGSGDEDIEINGPDTELTITFNAHYLLDAAKHLGGEKIELSLLDREASVVVKGPEDASALYVLMPIVA